MKTFVRFWQYLAKLFLEWEMFRVKVVENIETHILLDGCLTVHLPHEIIWNANLMQLGNFIDIFLPRLVSGTYAHHQEH